MKQNSQQPIPQDINEAEVEKYARLRGWEVAQALLPELQQLRETIVRLKEELAECQQTTKGVAEKGLEKIEQQKETIEELRKIISAYRETAVKLQMKIQSLKQEITEANGILRSCNSIIERRGEKTNWLAIEYKIKERLKKQHEILKQQTHG